MKKDELLKEYSKVMEKLLKPPYSKRINVPSVLNNSVGVLKSKNNEEIAELMIEVLELLKASAKTANLKIIDGKENAGKTLISKDISKLSDCKIIYQSITGIYEREVNLLENGLAYGSRDKSGEA